MKRIQASCFAILLGWTCLVSPSLLKGATHRAATCLSATASLSSRGTKPGSPVELLVTVRHALHPEIISVERPPSFKMHALRKPQLLSTEEGDVWIFRYRMIPGEIGDFEIPPIIVTDGVSSKYLASDTARFAQGRTAGADSGGAFAGGQSASGTW